VTRQRTLAAVPRRRNTANSALHFGELTKGPSELFVAEKPHA